MLSSLSLSSFFRRGYFRSRSIKAASLCLGLGFWDRINGQGNGASTLLSSPLRDRDGRRERRSDGGRGWGGYGRREERWRRAGKDRGRREMERGKRGGGMGREMEAEMKGEVRERDIQ